MVVDGVDLPKMEFYEFPVLVGLHILSAEEAPVTQETVENLVRFVYPSDNNFTIHINNTK
jgi:hypothetical protein